MGDKIKSIVDIIAKPYFGGKFGPKSMLNAITGTNLTKSNQLLDNKSSSNIFRKEV